jgi:hypothetical protein
MKMSDSKNPIMAATLSMIGGALILISSIFSITMFIIYGNLGWFTAWGCPCGMMWRWGGPITAWPLGGMMIFTPIIGVISGIMLITGGLMIRANPSDSSIWGVIILVFSIIGFIGGGGFFVGSLIGLIGGIIAITASQSGKTSI